MSLAARTIKNSFFSVGEYVWPIVLGLAATPYIVRTLGNEAYGVLAVVAVTLGFLGVLDFGLGGAATRHIADLHAKGDIGGVGDVVSTVLTLYALVGAAGSVLLLVLARPLANSVLDVPAPWVGTAEFVFYVAAPGFVVSLLLGTFSAIPRALQRFDIAAVMNTVFGTVNVVLTVGVLALGYGLRGLVVATLVVNTLAIVPYYLVARWLLGSLRIGFRIDTKLTRELASFGGFFLLSSLGVTALYQLDKFLIGSFLGVGLVTYYVIPGNLANKIQGFVAAATAVVFPLSSVLAGQEREETLRELYREGTRFVFVISTMIAVPAAVLADKFLLYWLGPEFAAESGTVMVLLVATYYLLASTALAWGISFGTGNAKINAWFTVAIALLNVGAFLLLVDRFALVGAAAAYLLSAAVGVPALIAFVERRVLGLSGFEFVRIWARIGVVAVLQVGLGLLCRNLATNLFSVIIVMSLLALSFPALYVLLGLWREGDRRVLAMVVARLRR